MRTLAALVLLSSFAVAQSNPLSPYPSGTPVGQPSLTPAGVAFPKVGTPGGTPVGYTGPDGRPINTGQRPAGQIIDLNNLAAPLSAPLQPGLMDPKPKTYLEQMFDKWKAALGFAPAPTPPASFYTPGLSRRNRERHETKWRRD
jgi:hypothetical protein